MKSTDLLQGWVKKSHEVNQMIPSKFNGIHISPNLKKVIQMPLKQWQSVYAVPQATNGK